MEQDVTTPLPFFGTALPANSTQLTCAQYMNISNGTYSWQTGGGQLTPMTLIFCCFYTLICVVGMLGNGLVIFVVLRYAKMKTVTNMYILNLAISDMCFLVGLPFLTTTLVYRKWLFGTVVCKLFYICTSINWFTSVFTLTVMSADRYFAVCHPIKSMNYRTPLVSRIVCVSVWTLSFLVMLPIILYTRLEHISTPCSDKVSCTFNWPKGQRISGEKAFIVYAGVLAFAGPVALISVFYLLVVLRLRHVGPKKKSGDKKRAHKKVTHMVLAVITVYIVCWLPYWCFQLALIFGPSDPKAWQVSLFQIFTLLSYANSMANPLLYAFLSDNFRRSFIKAFKCVANAEVNGALQVEHSMFPGRKSSQKNEFRFRKQARAEEEHETITLTTTAITTEHSKDRNGTQQTNLDEAKNVIVADKSSVSECTSPPTQV